MKFLPDDYKAPANSDNYFKILEGENRIRILSEPILGWEDWMKVDGKEMPVRFKMDEKPAKPNDATKPIRHFWSMVIWNCIEEKIQIMHVTQATIRNTIISLSKDADYGLPFLYDIKIKKKGEGKNTEYEVMPLPPKPISEHIMVVYDDKPIYLEALFSNMDPFSAGYAAYTPPFWFQRSKVVEIDE